MFGAAVLAFIPLHPKVPEMEFSDKVDIKNAQVCCPTPSRLGERVGQRPSQNVCF